MLVDATKEFVFEEIHQRPGKFSQRYVPVSDATYDLLDAIEPIGHRTRYELPYADNQLIGVCSTGFDHYSAVHASPVDATSSHGRYWKSRFRRSQPAKHSATNSTVDAFRDALTALHSKGEERLVKLRSKLQDSQTKYTEDADKRKKLLAEIKKIEDKHCIEDALGILQVGVGRCAEYAELERYHAFIDPRMSKLNAQICYLSLKEGIGDHAIVSYRDLRVSHPDPRHNLATEIPTSDTWSPMGYTSLMSERYLNHATSDWEVSSLTSPYKNTDRLPSKSFSKKMKSMNFQAPEITSDDRRLEIIYREKLFNRFSAAKDISVIYQSDSGKQKTLSSVPKEIADSFRFGLQRRDELMQRKLDLLALDQAKYTAADMIEMRQAVVSKFTTVV